MKMKVSTGIESIHYLTSINTMSEFRTFLMDKNKCPDFLLKTLASECYAYYIHHEFDRMGYIYKMIENICKSEDSKFNSGIYSSSDIVNAVAHECMKRYSMEK